MNMRDLIPWGRSERSMVPSTLRGEEISPFMTLHREMNRLFDDMFNRFEPGMPSLLGRMPGWPNIEAVETDKDVRISAELPGMDEKDIEVLVDEDVLTIRGEKKAETEDKERRFSERYYGRFERVIPLPFAVEDDTVEASFNNGVLTVTLPKSAKAQEKAKRIPVNGKAKGAKH
ncbi:Hsp20/alpha crystallin family protein [Microvirga pakistanensis]|uniref:Hsp20/alpha crystallin family protein n=1 Tax=Microvirga pakistanensis TaxID=1682650 RepID=UPI00106D72FE|nr:Hsp20/alpha crystallin family protein [Microvirga pakistanensis]